MAENNATRNAALHDRATAAASATDPDVIDLVYRKFGHQRFTQDSPILLSVFDAYYRSPGSRVDVLITPDWSVVSAQLAAYLTVALDSHTDPTDSGQSRIAHNKSVIAASLTFDELLLHVLPLSSWWNDFIVQLDGVSIWQLLETPGTRQLIEAQLVEGFAIMESTSERATPATVPATSEQNWLLHRDFIWGAHLISVIKSRTDPTDDPPAAAEAVMQFIDSIARSRATTAQALTAANIGISPPDSAWVFSVHLNRPVTTAIHRSVRTTKGDAAIRAFDIKGEGIVWAVIDSGIDATHRAFRKDWERDPFDGPNTRIRATYNFVGIRDLLANRQQQAVYTTSSRMLDWESFEAENEALLERDSSLPRFRVAHDEKNYVIPKSAHGTHVAGILAANWRNDLPDPLGPPIPQNGPRQQTVGMCPEIELYDLRVFGDDGEPGDEFSVICALQFVRDLNERFDTLEIHGANLSLSSNHDVTNYACGTSPICEESNHLVGTGVVVVAAAGNDGRSMYTSTARLQVDGYRDVSIADPGNADRVITVGATHRSDPHTYGVSYFSSRGPTGDGRLKPDLVAPGEKIYSTVPRDRFDLQDGTSQAAPHVSGAAALLMCRHRELIGNPARVKAVLMATATDLGREAYFQGAGLVDVMRAIQSI